LFALLALLLLGRRSAIFLSIVYALMMFTFDSFLFTSDNIENVYSTLMVCFFAGMLAIFVVSEQISRFKVFLRSIIIYLPIALIILLMEISEQTDVLLMLSYGLLGALSSVVIFIAILPLFENIFNVVTDYRLRELCDHDYKLIKDLKEKASGTFNHSIIVAYLAEACAIAINEDTALARAAAYYHDVGKLKQPEFFAENQTGYNPHDELAPELSVDIIRSHARDGYELIKAHRLPAQLADVALQHHGTMPITYFYAKALKLTDGEVKREDFSYYGPKPQSKIAAIIMICDASEAITRTLVNRLPENVEKAVREVIEERMNYEQFSDCEITMKDLSVIKDTIVTYLTGVNHSRVKYPKLKIKAKTQVEIKEEEEKNV
jgi:putative nucleotidyltransferase with HDIG domain